MFNKMFDLKPRIFDFNIKLRFTLKPRIISELNTKPTHGHKHPPPSHPLAKHSD